MPSYTSEKLRYKIAEQYKNAFSTPENPFVAYITIGNHIPYANEANPDIILDTVATEKKVWDNMIAGKKVTGNDVELVIPRIDWTANNKYRQFDDTIQISDLLSANASQNLQPMYVINSEGNVYKCISNNVGEYATVEPIGQNLSANGNILTADNYIWKYMYNVLEDNKFSSNVWIPVPSSTSYLEYSGSVLTSVDGELLTIHVDDSGSGYTENTIIVSAFSAACSVLTVDYSVDMANVIANNMIVSGQGLVSGTYITNVDNVNRKINLSYASIEAGGGSSNTIDMLTRVVVQGDGVGATADPVVSNGSITKIMMTSFGKDYTYANVFIYGTSTGANVCNARTIITPKFGHSYNPASELGAHNVMIAVKFGEVDSTEGNVISSNTSFRQYALLLEPYKYNETQPLTYANANTVISQTTDLTLIAGDLYERNEMVYQGSLSNPSFSGYVDTQTTDVINLTNVRGLASVGLVLKGTTTNITGRTVFGVKHPELQRYTGDIEYAENFEEIQRSDGQAENLKYIVKL